MNRSAWDHVRSLLAGLLLVGCIAYVLLYLGIAVARIGYPFELEWMEGGMADHVRRILAGKPIYAKPSLEFVSFLYPPLYYLVAAGFATILGPALSTLRLVSLLSSIGVLALLYRIVRNETGSRLPGVLAAGLFAATYNRVGGWFDLARLDSFYLLLLLGSVYVLRCHPSRRGAIWAGVLMGAAFLTKQSATVIAIPLVAYCLVNDVKRAAYFAGAAVVVGLGGAFLLDLSSDGWFGYYCFYLPSRHPRLPGGLLAFWTKDVLPALPVALAVAAIYLARRLGSKESKERFFFPLLASGMILSSWSVRNMLGAEVNNLLPAFAAISILAALGLHELVAKAAERGGGWQPIALLAQALLAAQLVMLAYNPGKHIPTAADEEAGVQLVARLARIPGDVYIPHHGYLAIRAGKRSFAHTLAVDNLHVEDPGPARRDLEQEIVEALALQRFSAVVIESDGWHAHEILVSYRIAERLWNRPDVFWPVTGAHLRPAALCLPR